MQGSRRKFLAASSMLLAGACSKALGITGGRLSAKKGLGGAAPAASGLKTSWYYNWGVDPSTQGVPASDPSMQFMPMVWGWYPEKTPAALERLRRESPPKLLGFNEPDHRDQSNIPVETALAAWPKFEGIAGELISPAAAAPLGPWMRSFMSGVAKQKLRVDSIAVHAYPQPSPKAFLEMLNRVHDTYGRPLWITEFAVADWQAKNGAANRFSVSQVADFMQEVCTAMEKTPWVKGYAWFPFAGKASNALRTSVLFDENGELTELGRLYARL